LKQQLKVDIVLKICLVEQHQKPKFGCQNHFDAHFPLRVQSISNLRRPARQMNWFIWLLTLHGVNITSAAKVRKYKPKLSQKWVWTE
jgi:hypothetical protein